MDIESLWRQPGAIRRWITAGAAGSLVPVLLVLSVLNRSWRSLVLVIPNPWVCLEAGKN